MFVHSPGELGHVFDVVDVCAYLGVCYLVLHVRDAGETADRQHCIHGKHFLALD